jgi:hypothetical protein
MSGNFPQASKNALYPRAEQDPMYALADAVKSAIAEAADQAT